MTQENVLRQTLEKSLHKIQALNKEIERLKAKSQEPIAIVSMACRFPGGIDSPEALWSLLEEGRDATGPLPDGRGWDLEHLYDPDPAAKGKSATNRGGFLYDADRFDPAFFGISPRETERVDPQQRLLLECAWEAIERARMAPHTLEGGKTGVFVGIVYNDYGGRLLNHLEAFDGYVAGGSFPSLAAGRIAYTLGLRGPAVTVDTACSSSLVAIHLACMSLRADEADFALAGGATVMATPMPLIESSRQRGMAADGRCKAFGASADGMGAAEGCGVIALKRLSDARRDGDEILAIIRGSAINHDGRSQGLTAPSGPSQQAVIRQALAASGVDASDVDVVEAHGTGTRLGDPIEAQALLATYGRAHPPERPLWLGSLKSNIGHTQAAAGVAGLMKLVLAMQHGALPRTLHAHPPSPHIDWSQGHIALLQSSVAWPRGERPRCGAVSSFGVSGTNAHLIVEECSAPTKERASSPPRSAFPILLSGRDEAALRAQARRLVDHLRACPSVSAIDVAASLATTRSHHATRLAFTLPPTGTTADLADALDGLAAGGPPPPHASMSTGSTGRGKLAVLFTGQGSQRPNMGRELYATSSAFKTAFDAVCVELDRHLSRPLRDVMFAEAEIDAALVHQTELAQPALFALEVALFAHWQSLGLRPQLLVGHSIGEIAAAYVAGVLDLRDACTLVAARGRLMQALPGGGAMAAIEAAEEELGDVCEAEAGRVSIAALNGPRQAVVSGDADVVDRVAMHFEKLGRRTKRLEVSHAFHSARMEPMLARFAAVARGLSYSPAKIPIVSTVSGRLAEADELASADYWVRQIRATVRFSDAVSALAIAGATTYLECGPDSVLSAMADACLTAAGADTSGIVPCLRKGRAESETLARAVCAVHVRHHNLTLGPLFEGASRVTLPTYPFQRQRFWLDVPTLHHSGAGANIKLHPWLATATALADRDVVVLGGHISTAEHPWLLDHVVDGVALLPGTGFVEIALAAAHAVGLGMVAELTLEQPLALPRAAAIEVQLTIEGKAARRTFVLHARPDASASWSRHASGVLAEAPERVVGDEIEAAVWPPPDATAVDGAGYASMAEHKYGHGPSFQGLRDVMRKGSLLFAHVSLPEGVEAGAFRLHPALFDAALQSVARLALEETNGEGSFLVPFSFADVAVHHTGATEVVARIEIERTVDGLASVASLVLVDRDGHFVATAGRLRGASASSLATPVKRARPIYRIVWNKLDVPAEPKASPNQSQIRRKRPIGSAVAVGGEGEVAGSLLIARREPRDLLAAGSEPPVRVFVDLTSAPDDAHAVAAELVARLQEWIREPSLASTEIVVVTRGAVAVNMDGCDVTARSSAVAWGLVRSLRTEHPSRTIRLVDLDPAAKSIDGSLVNRSLALDEPELALRHDEVRVPRLRPIDDAAPASTTKASFAADGTVLVTGGTGALGREVARHLVRAHGVRHLLLLSRRGMDEESRGLSNELRSCGADSVEIAACDVADRRALSVLLDRARQTRPLTAIIHTAGIIEDAIFENVTIDQLARVFRPKIDGALHLAELTKDESLSAFVLFSSAAGLLGNPGQTSYAAANAFLDALSAELRGRGVPATSLAWGLVENSGMASRLSPADLARIRSEGMSALSKGDAMAQLDRALGLRDATLAPIALDVAMIERAAAEQKVIRPLLRDLVRRRNGAASNGNGNGRNGAAALRTRLLPLSVAARQRAVCDLVQSDIAAVMELGGSAEKLLSIDTPLKELGLDSLMSVELRNRLAARVGASLPATLGFDYPTPRAIAGYLLELLDLPIEGARRAGDEDEERIRAALARIPIAAMRKDGLLDRLLRLDASVAHVAPASTAETSLADIADDELVRLALEVSGGTK